MRASVPARTMALKPGLWAASGVCLAAALLLAVELMAGAIFLGPARVWQGLMGDDPLARQLVLELRLPRALLALLVGASLGAAGTLLQGATRNPLADPHLLGVSGGAAVVGAGLLAWHPDTPAPVAMALAALGALAGSAPLVALVGRGMLSAAGMALVGVGLGYLWAVVALALVTSAGLLAAPSLSFLGGSLSGRGWDDLRWLLAFTAMATVPLAGLVRPLDALALGDEVARSLGTSPPLVRAGAAAAAALLVGPAAWAAGTVPLVGLACAQAARTLWGRGHLTLLPGAAALGAVLVLAADVVARSLLRGTELPLGIVTACVGVPALVGVAWRASWRTLY